MISKEEREEAVAIVASAARVKCDGTNPDCPTCKLVNKASKRVRKEAVWILTGRRPLTDEERKIVNG